MLTKPMYSLIHCKHCRGLLLKDMHMAEMDGIVSFLIRCPHCKRDCKVEISMSKLPAVHSE